MSLASDAIKLGFDLVSSNAEIAGETITFRGESISASIQRNTGQGVNPLGQVKTSTDEEATVQISSEVTPAPRRGQTLTTANGHEYRIEQVVFLPHCYQLRCAVLR